MVCTSHRRAGDSWERFKFSVSQKKLNEGRCKINAFIEANDSDCCQCDMEWLRHNGRGIDMWHEVAQAKWMRHRRPVVAMVNFAFLAQDPSRCYASLERSISHARNHTKTSVNHERKRKMGIIEAIAKHPPFCTSRGAVSLAFCVSYEELAVLTPMKFIKAASTWGT
jgi:hypothetical protein